MTHILCSPIFPDDSDPDHRISAASITTDILAAGVVTAGKLAVNSVSSDRIFAGAIREGVFGCGWETE